MTAILRRGDVVHLAVPCASSSEEDERIFRELEQAYARYGVALWVTAHEATTDFQIVAIFREDT